LRADDVAETILTHWRASVPRPCRAATLQEDSRYTVLEPLADVREQMLHDHARELERKAEEEHVKRMSVNPNATIPASLAAPSEGP